MRKRLSRRNWRRLALLGWGLCLLILLLSLAYHWRQRPVSPVAAQVDDLKVTQDEYHAALRLAHGRPLLEKLIGYRLIELAARQHKLVVDDKKMALKEAEIQAVTTDPEMRKILLLDARCQDLLRQLVLRNHSEADILEDCRVFREELIEYEVAAVLVGNEQDLNSVKASLRIQGDFANLAATFDVDPESRNARGYVGWLTKRGAQERWGVEAAKELSILAVPQVSPPLRLPRGWLFLKLMGKKDTDTHVRQRVEDLLVKADEPALTLSLLRSATVQSRYFQDTKLLPDVSLLPSSPTP